MADLLIILLLLAILVLVIVRNKPATLKVDVNLNDAILDKFKTKEKEEVIQGNYTETETRTDGRPLKKGLHIPISEPDRTPDWKNIKPTDSFNG